MSDPLPLADAARRLRGKPGRPRTDRPSTAPAEIPPRLLSRAAAARYLGITAWSLIDLDNAGVIARVRIPLPNGGELRRALYDRESLDLAIATWKDGPA